MSIVLTHICIECGAVHFDSGTCVNCGGELRGILPYIKELKSQLAAALKGETDDGS